MHWLARRPSPSHSGGGAAGCRVAIDMRLSVHLVTGGKYVRAGDPLPADFVLPEHLDRFVVDDDPPQIFAGRSLVFLCLSDTGGFRGGGGSRNLRRTILRARKSSSRQEGQNGRRNSPPTKGKEKNYETELQLDSEQRPRGSRARSTWRAAQSPTNSFQTTRSNTGSASGRAESWKRELLEWQAMVAERQAKKKREAAEKRGSARASKA